MQSHANRRPRLLLASLAILAAALLGACCPPGVSTTMQMQRPHTPVLEQVAALEAAKGEAGSD